MKVLIFGGSGVIGSKLANLMKNEGDEIFFTYDKNPFKIEGCESFNLDIKNRDETLDIIKKIDPDITIHTISVTSVDRCEIDRNLANIINVQGTKNIVDGCKIISSKIVFISTSFVFDGKKKLYLEDDRPNPINYYGLTKLLGERIVCSSGLPFIIARTDQLYGNIKEGQKENNVIRLIKKLDNGETAKEFLDWYNNPTFVDNCAEVINELIKKNRFGFYHTVGPDYINRYEWGLKIAEIFKKNKNMIKSIMSNESKLPAKRPNCNLSNKNAEGDSGKMFLNIEDGLKLMYKEKFMID